ncbi:hypothetical protein BaRGS_00037042, partial [Batillaria attramentaria]
MSSGSTQYLATHETSRTTPTFGRNALCSKKRLVVAAVIGIVLVCVVVGLAVGLSQTSEDSHSSRVKRANDILAKYPLIDG